jgi:hypothetical protein
LLQKVEVIFLQIAEIDLLVFLDLKRRVIFCQTFVEPRRNFGFAEIRVEQVMHVFVKDHIVSVFLLALGRERDVIDVLARLKIAGQPFVGLAVGAFRLKRLVGRRVFKNDDVGLNRLVKLGARKKLAEGFAKLFEFGRHAANVLFARVADEKEVFRAHARPVIFGFELRRSRNRREQNHARQKQQQQHEKGEAIFHFVSNLKET